MKTRFAYQTLGTLFLLGWILAGCTNPPETSSTAEPSKLLTLTTSASSPVPAVSTQAMPRLTATAVQKTNTPPSPTETLVMDADGNVTWHPEKKLIAWGESPNDGNSAYVNPDFVLFWDGTLLQPSYDSFGNNIGPSTAKLNQDEICKVLNTVDKSGFFEEPNDYNFPFAGGWSSYISVNGWKTNWSGSQQLYSAVRGEPYYDILFCRDCPIPSQQTIIRPALANIYYFLQNYEPKGRHLAEIKKWHVSFYASEEKSDRVWPLKSISFDELWAKCQAEYCMDTGMEIEGDMAKEFLQKIEQDQPYPLELSDDYHSLKMYVQEIWPDGPEVPADATLTCNTKTAGYPLLPLNPNNKFWYYAVGGSWGAEIVANENKIRVVNKSGYEKFYGYDPTFFGRPSIQFYPRFWSLDEQFFYVNILPGDYNPEISLANSIGLQQIDVKNEKIKYLFLGTQGETFTYEFSTVRETVAYIRQGDQPLKLVVANPVSSQEQAVRLTRPDGTPYTSAETLFWYEDNDTIYIAAGYTENGATKTDILATNSDTLANLRIIYTANEPMNLFKDLGSDSSVLVCPMQKDPDKRCSHLNAETGEVKE